MTCYLRHLDDIMLAAGIRPQRENRARLHAIISELTGEDDCPRIWKRVRCWLLRDETWEKFVADLRTRWQQATLTRT